MAARTSRIGHWTLGEFDYSRRVVAVSLDMIYPVSGLSNGYGPVPPPYATHHPTFRPHPARPGGESG